MPSYVNPNVIDHNLYGTMIPQFPLEAVMKLGAHRQGLYNAGVSQARDKVSSMLNMENNVSSIIMQDTVNDFNKKANDIIKGYSTLDFSIGSNVDLVSATYDPLINDKHFMMDYSATINKKREVAKALNLRDNKDADLRNTYSDINLQRLLMSYDDLSSATTLKQLEQGASAAQGARYTPYEDYKKTIRELVTDKSFFARESSTPTGTGYMVTYKGLDYSSMSAFLQANLTAKELGQMRIEGEVGFNNVYKSSGLDKGQFALETSRNSLSAIQEGVNDLRRDVEDSIKLLETYSDDSKLSTKKLAEKNLLKQRASVAQSILTNQEKKLENYQSTIRDYVDGNVSKNVLFNTLQGAYAQEYTLGTIDQMARSYGAAQTVSYGKDDAFWSRLSENRLSARLSLDNKKFAFDQKKHFDNLVLGYLKEGFRYDSKTGKFVKAGVGTGGTRFLGLDPEQASALVDIFPNIKAFNERDLQIKTDKRDNNTSALTELARTVSRDMTGRDASNLGKFFDFVSEFTANPEYADLTSMSSISRVITSGANYSGLTDEVKQGLAAYEKFTVDMGVSITDGKNLMESFAKIFEGNISNGSATPDQKEIYNRWSSKKVINDIEGWTVNDYKEKLVTGFDTYLKEKGFIGSPLIYKAGDINFRRLSFSPSDRGLSNIVDEGHAFELFEEYMSSSKDIAGTVQGFKQVINLEGAAATSEVIQNIGLLVNNFEQSKFTEEDIDPGFGKGTTAFDVGFTFGGDQQEADAVNSIVKSALLDVQNRGITTYSNKNVGSAVSGTNTTPTGTRVRFSKEYLSYVVGLTDLVGKEISDFGGYAGFNKEKTKTLIDVLSTEGFFFKTGDLKPTISNSVFDYLNSGHTVPITNPGTKMTYEISLSEGDPGSVDVYVNNPEGDILFDPKMTYMIKDGELISRDIQSNRLESFKLGAEGLPLQTINSNLQYQADLNNYVMSDHFLNTLDKLIQNGTVKADNIPFNVIGKIYSSSK